MTSVLAFLITSLCTLFCAALLLCAWIFWRKIPSFNPFVLGLYNLTNWFTRPIKKIIKPYQKLDLATLIGAWLTCVIELVLMFLLYKQNLMENLWFIPTASILLLLKNTLNLVFWITLIYVIMSWVNPLSPSITLFRTLIEPLLRPLRQLPLLRNMQTLDLSPLVVALITQALLILIAQLSHRVMFF